MSKGREALVGVVIIAAIAVGVVGTLWLKRMHWGRPLTPLQILVLTRPLTNKHYTRLRIPLTKNIINTRTTQLAALA